MSRAAMNRRSTRTIRTPAVPKPRMMKLFSGDLTNSKTCSGNEIIGPLTTMTMPELLEFTRMTGDLVKSMRNCPQPVISAIDGICAGAGAMIALACDFRVMREDRGFWCLPEVDLGLPLTPAMFAVVEAHVPRQALHDSCLSGRRYSGPEALAAGIVDEVGAGATTGVKVGDAVMVMVVPKPSHGAPP